MQFSKSTVCISNEVKGYSWTARNVALLICTLVMRKCSTFYTYTLYTTAQSIIASINQSINHCRTQQMAIKLAHMWKYYHLRSESDSYNSEEVNFTCKCNDNNQRMKWWENFIERTKTRRALRFLAGVRGQRQLSSALSDSYQPKK